MESSIVSLNSSVKPKSRCSGLESARSIPVIDVQETTVIFLAVTSSKRVPAMGWKLSINPIQSSP
ncbi:MAG: hypothetical protein IPG23_13670 [Burkholderiales bacterium]|jgi:hypothetical protein|nr:hypothetical protein [Burkholderiales bacterium]